ncbi:hypothetical protein Lokhon_02405 [Limimaricola hongkongensis DSM 17492]|uniref:Uncharacterized protein n=1 Tax=Limimaricola hongkongensis DSM 17492 TaxID=1122180 RepID=A0A017H9D6_9RHOB|nr:hypothetical protein Lokhon_02405 [Limimaricola hongkongensis DSM 17492]
MLAVLPLLAACEEVRTVAVPQPAPVFPAPQPTPAPLPEPSSPLEAPSDVSTAPLSESDTDTDTASTPPPPSDAVTVTSAEEVVTPPDIVLAALLPGTPPSAVIQNGDGCYLFSIERTEPLSGYPVRDSSGAPLCENDDGTVGPRPAS